MKSIRLAVLLSCAAALGACDSSSGDVVKAAGDVGASGSDAAGTGTTGTTSDGGTTGGTTGSTVAVVEPPVACSDTKPCASGESCIDGACVVDPKDPVKLTDNRTDTVLDGQKPDLSCVGKLPADDANPKTALLYGIVDRFGKGRETINIEVSVFKAAEWPPKSCVETPVEGEEQRDCFRALTSSLTAVSVDPRTEGQSIPATCTRHTDCPSGFDGVEVDLDHNCLWNYGTYQIADVPTNTWLVIRSKNTDDLLDKSWRDTYLYGVYLFEDLVQTTGCPGGAARCYNYHALMVSQSQWTTVPTTLLVPGGIKKGNAAIGGRLRDCPSGKDRPSFTLGKASVGLAAPGASTGYFNDNEEKTVPVLDNTSTGIFGRFAIVDVPPGPNRIAGSILLDGKVTSLSSEIFYVVPDSLNVVSFPGKVPVLTKP